MNRTSTVAASGAFVVPHTEFGTLVVTGPERQSWLNGIVTCDVGALSPGQGVWGLVLTRTGKITSEIHVVNAEHRLLVATSEGTAAVLAESLNRMLIMEDAELQDESSKFVWLSVHGPGAGDLARQIGQAGEATVARVEWLGTADALVVLERSHLDRALEQASASAIIATAEDWSRLRLEAGVPEYGSDFSDRNNPHEAALERRCVSWNKGCYLGQEVVCMQDMRGKVRRRLKSLVFDVDSPPEKGTELSDPATAEVVGQVTSSVFSRAVGKAIGLGMLSNSYKVGSSLRAAQAMAKVVEPPL